MKTAANLLLVVCTLLFASCVHHQGEGWKTTLVATNAKRVKATQSALIIERLDQTTAIKESGAVMTTLARVRAWFGLANTATKELGDVGSKLLE